MSADPEDYELVRSNLRLKPWYECTESELSDCVEIWHMLNEAAPSVDCPLYEFLGMTEAEYQAWIADPEAAKAARREETPKK